MISTQIRSLALVTALSLAAASLSFTDAFATPPSHEWSEGYGGIPDDEGHAVAVDGAGNIHVTGYFQGQANFGGGVLLSAGETDAFIAKFDNAGNHIWSKRFGDALGDHGDAIAVDNSGNVYVTGDFWGSIDLGGDTLTSAGLSDIFLAKFDSNGNHIWSQSFGGPNGQIPESIALGPNAEVHITGLFVTSVDFGGGALVSAGLDDIFLAKFDSNGTHEWSQRLGSGLHQNGWSVAVNSGGDVFLAADFEGTVMVGDCDTLVSAGQFDMMIAKFASDGTCQWGIGLGDAQDDTHALVASDGAGGVLVAGSFQGTVDFGGGNLVSAGHIDMFIARYNSIGNHQWSQRYGDTSADVATAIVVDGAGSLIVTGIYTGAVNFGGSTLFSNDQPVVLASYDAMGGHEWSTSLAGPSFRGSPESITIDSNDQITMTGFFSGTAAFGGAPFASTAGRNDIFVASFAPGTPTGIGTTPTIKELALRAHPNPFRPSVTLQFTLPSTAPASLDIFDIRGRRVRSIASPSMSAGVHSERWDGRDDSGRQVASGIYFARIRQGETIGTARLVLVR